MLVDFTSGNAEDGFLKVVSISGTTVKFNTAVTFGDDTTFKFIPNVEIGWIIDNLPTSATGT